MSCGIPCKCGYGSREHPIQHLCSYSSSDAGMVKRRVVGTVCLGCVLPRQSNLAERSAEKNAEEIACGRSVLFSVCVCACRNMRCKFAGDVCICLLLKCMRSLQAIIVLDGLEYFFRQFFGLGLEEGGMGQKVGNAIFLTVDVQSTSNCCK